MTAYRNIVDVESVRQLSGDNSDHDKQRRYWPVDQRSRRIHPAFLQAVAVLCLCSVYEMKFTLSRTSRASLSNVVCSDSGENEHYNNDEVTVYTYYFCRHVPDWQGDGSGSPLTAEAHTHTHEPLPWPSVDCRAHRLTARPGGRYIVAWNDTLWVA